MSLLDQVSGGLIASCQPIENGPMDRPEIVAAMAQAAVAGGAVGLRIEGVDNLLAVRSVVGVPIIGIVKRDLPDSPVRITVTAQDARALIDAGADIIAYDATQRPRPDSRQDIVTAIVNSGAMAMADCATFEDARNAIREGASIVGTTLSGYTEDTRSAHDLPDFDLIRRCRELECFLMAEGRFNTPNLASKAIAAGADAVTVGSALTRLETVTGWFAEAVRSS